MLFCSVFNDTVNSLDPKIIASNDRMIDSLKPKLF
jgi:hypothetical protein